VCLERVFDHQDAVMVEEYLTGREITCSVIDAEPGGFIQSLPLTEIRPRQEGRFWDYAAKYTPGATEETTPAPLEPEVTDQIMEMGAHAHEIVGCEGWSRSDFILTERGPMWLEINTVPGLTETSLYPQAAAAAGISYERMVCLFVEAAVRKGARKGQRV